MNHANIIIYQIQKYNYNIIYKYYNIIYRRFAYLELKKLKNLYKVTNLKRLIKVLIDYKICKVYKLTKLRNRISKVLSL